MFWKNIDSYLDCWYKYQHVETKNWGGWDKYQDFKPSLDIIYMSVPNFKLSRQILISQYKKTKTIFALIHQYGKPILRQEASLGLHNDWFWLVVPQLKQF